MTFLCIYIFPFWIIEDIVSLCYRISWHLRTSLYFFYRDQHKWSHNTYEGKKNMVTKWHYYNTCSNLSLQNIIWRKMLFSKKTPKFRKALRDACNAVSKLTLYPQAKNAWWSNWNTLLCQIFFCVMSSRLVYSNSEVLNCKF